MDRYLKELQRTSTTLAAAGTPMQRLHDFAEVLHACVGFKLLTVLVIDRVRDESRRVYSSRPDIYPVSGAKPIRPDSPFFKKVIERGEPSISRTLDECAAAFPDHEVFAALGCGSVANIPIRWNGVTLGSFNLVAEEGKYSDRDLPILNTIGALAIPVILQALDRA
ncbi:GAF domain-containing protein [Bordetella sp. N]|uniref:GAF domain-containing protein n=1 Tax=Bordetella sp. N TaxID=1746199 RepID=UPI000A4DAB26|nr:GAF domain-containing protein [Bordetella sp. N]